MTLAIEWWVPASEDGFDSVNVDDSSSPYDATVSGYQTFRDWIAALETQINAGAANYSFSYAPSIDRVVLSVVSGPDCGFTWASDSMAKLLGWETAADTATPASVHTAPNPPGGLIVIQGWPLRSASPGKRVERQDFGFRRARNAAFGSGVEFDLSIITLASDTTRWLEGPCAAGRVRIGDLTASAALSSAETAGYIDGTWVSIGRPSTNYPVPLHHTTEAKIRTGTADTSQRTGAAGSFQLLERGFHLALWARIEGLPYTFSETSLGVGSSAQPESDTLTVPPRSQISYQVDREKGTTGGGQLRIGIIDPDDDLGIFGGASLKAELTADLAFDDTSADVDDTTGFASSGILYAGHEAITYSGTTSTTFTGMTRGDRGPAYTLRASAPLAWGTITDRPIQWPGRVVHLWGVPCDAYGRPIPDRDVELWVGETTAQPIYDSGVWWFDCESILLRLSRPVGQESEGVLAPQSRYSGVGLANGPVVGIHSDATISYIIQEPSTPFSSFGSFAVSTILASQSECVTSSDYLFVPFATIANAACGAAKAAWLAAGGPSGSLTPFVVGIAQEESGEWVVEIRASATGVFPGDGIYRIGPVINPDGTPWRGWNSEIVISADTLQKVNIDGGLHQFRGLFRPGLNGKTIDSAVVSLGQEFLLSGLDWSTDGVVVIDGDDGYEIASYEDAFTEDGRAYLPAMVRGLSNTSRANLHAQGTAISRYITLTGKAGVQLASLLESSGYGDRGDYDTLDLGYALGTDIVAEDQLGELQGGAMITATAIAPGESAADHFGGLLAAQGYAIAPVRDGMSLLIGIVGINPFGITSESLTDADIRTDAGPILREINPSPNVVEIKPASLGGLDRAVTRTVLREAALAEGERVASYTLPATASTLASSLLRAWSQQSMASRRGCVVYEFQVGPGRDWLPGRLLAIDVSHPAMGVDGFSGRGVVLAASRSLDGRVRLSVLIRADALDVSPLCPSARVTSIVGSVIRIDTTTVPIVAGDKIRAYEAGVSGSLTDISVSGISGNAITLGSVPGWLTGTAISRGAVYITYPDVPDCSDAQEEYVHVEDGTSWL